MKKPILNDQLITKSSFQLKKSISTDHLRSSHLRSNHLSSTHLKINCSPAAKKQNNYNFFAQYKNAKHTLQKNRNIRAYESMPKDRITISNNRGKKRLFKLK